LTAEELSPGAPAPVTGSADERGLAERSTGLGFDRTHKVAYRLGLKALQFAQNRNLRCLARLCSSTGKNAVGPILPTATDDEHHAIANHGGHGTVRV